MLIPVTLTEDGSTVECPSTPASSVRSRESSEKGKEPRATYLLAYYLTVTLFLLTAECVVTQTVM